MSNPSSGQNSGLSFRILVAGEEGVGKRSIIERFVQNRFDESTHFSAPEGGFVTTQLNLFGAPVKLQIQALGNKEIWDEVASFYISENDGVLVVFDTSQKAKVKPYIDQYLQVIKKNNQDLPIIVIGNKSDLEVKVNIGKIAQYTAKLGSNLIQTSAKTGDNVSYAFKLITSEIVKQKAAVKKRQAGTRSDGLDTYFDQFNL